MFRTLVKSIGHKIDIISGLYTRKDIENYIISKLKIHTVQEFALENMKNSIIFEKNRSSKKTVVDRLVVSHIVQLNVVIKCFAKSRGDMIR